jgi:hypothetical protein
MNPRRSCLKGCDAMGEDDSLINNERTGDDVFKEEDESTGTSSQMSPPGRAELWLKPW